MTPRLVFDASAVTKLREGARPVEVAQVPQPEATGGGTSTAPDNGLLGTRKSQSGLSVAPKENIGALDPDYIR